MCSSDLIRTKNYFGPDRRRQKGPYTGSERRKQTSDPVKETPEAGDGGFIELTGTSLRATGAGRLRLNAVIAALLL